MIIRNQNRIKGKHLLTIASVVALVGFGCSSEDKVSRGGAKKVAEQPAQEQQDATKGGDEANEQIPQLSASLTKIRNKDEIFATMSRLTGIAMTDPGVSTYFRQQVEGSLPTGSDISSFLGSHQVAIVKLASQMCDLAYQSPDLSVRQGVYSDLDFSRPSIELFTTANKDQLVRHLFTKFWGVDGDSMELTDDADNPLKLMLDLTETQFSNIAKAKPGATDADRNRGVAVSLCTALLASAPVTMY